MFASSIAIALVASIAALWLSFYFRQERTRGWQWKKAVSGLIMGAAVVGMHYTGMAAAQFHIGSKAEAASGIVLDQTWLAYFIAGGTLFTLGLSLFGIFISNRFSRKDSEIEEKAHEIHLMNQELRELNDHLEELVRERTAELEKAHDEAIKANMIKSQFLANMSHELRTPLNAIIGYSEMLIEEAEELNEPAFADDLDKIRKAGNHLLSLINDILDISKIEAGKMNIFLEKCDLTGFIQDVVTTVRPIVERNGNRLEIRAAEGEITTDVTKLRQILINLLSNAGKFTHNGEVLLEIFPEAKSNVAGYRFLVRDSGIGMTPEQMETLFQPFMQADNSTTRKYGGTGLGLAISQRFCQLMGGDIEVASEYGKGSVFTCWFPQLPSEQTEAPRMPDQDQIVTKPAFTRQVNLLLIDDEPSNHELIQRYLDKEGWTLEVAENGAKGLEMAKKLRPQVILLDILMPSTDGWSVLAAIKSDPELQDIPVVIWSITSDRQLGYALGAAEFLMKPVQRERLLDVINKYIPKKAEHTVLVIEDDAATNELMARLLQKEGYTAVQAGNGKSALDYMMHQLPELILLDLMMPEMDGFQFVGEIRKKKEWNDIPVVVITAKSVTPEERQILNGNVKAVIQKGSVNYKALMSEIERLIAAAVEKPD